MEKPALLHGRYCLFPRRYEQKPSRSPPDDRPFTRRGPATNRRAVIDNFRKPLVRKVVTTSPSFSLLKIAVSPPTRVHEQNDLVAITHVKFTLGFASTFGHDDHHWKIKARAVGRHARPPERPSPSDNSTYRDPQQWDANCPQQEATGDRGPQTHINCARTINVRRRAVLARRPSHRLRPVRCEFMSPTETTSSATENTRTGTSSTISSETSGEQSPSGTQVEGGADCELHR